MPTDDGIFLDELPEEEDEVGAEIGVSEVERMVTSTISSSARSMDELASDENFTAALHNFNLGSGGNIKFGKIVYSQPYTHWYRVQLDDMDGDLSCCRITETASLPFSISDTSPLPPNCNVLVWVPDEVLYGYIMGVVPDKVESGAFSASDWISQGSGVGYHSDEYYYALLDLTLQDGGTIDFSNDRPRDATNGDWGRFSQLGGGLHIDMFMSFLRMDETCGLWLFYLDKMARLAGYNFDLITAISEMNVRDNNGEGLHYSGFTPYPWEALGCFTSGEDCTREFSDQAVLYKEPRGKIEPADDKVAPFFRLEEYRGYVGNGYMRQIRFPQKANGNVNTPDAGDPRSPSPALFRESISLDGGYSLSSAHSISLTKRMILPAGYRKVKPESVNGDTKENYKFSNVNGEGSEHQIKSPTAEGDNSHIQETMAVSDFAAYTNEWKALHVQHYHTEDYDLPDQADHSSIGMNSLQTPLNFSLLLNESHLPPPSPVQVEVDHRYGDVDYFPVTSGIFLLPEGGVVIRDGQGGEIRMVGGSIQISCPGDVYLQPGRNINMYAGDDIIGRAASSIDFTATNHDVRFKAENNLEFLAGNSGRGRMLFESKSIKTEPDTSSADKFGEDIEGSGFVFKAKHAEFVTACRGIYLRTGSGDIDEGPIVLDASKGESDIFTISNAFERHIKTTARDSFPAGETKESVNEYGKDGARIGSGCVFDGGIRVLDGGMVVTGQVNILEGHIGTEFAEKKDFNGHVGVIKGANLAISQKYQKDEKEKFEEAQEQAESNFKTSIKKIYYEDGQPGDTDFQDAASFSLRTETQMNTDGFLLAETYWQQLARVTGNIPGKWSEKSISYLNRDMMPHPGIDSWANSASWLTQELKLHDPTDGLDKSRGSDYEDYEYGDITPQTADGNYPIIS